MRMLAIDCATEACSLALFDGDALLASRHEILGRGHAEQLIPLIASFPDKGRAQYIHVSLGPGSFTGVRIGLAAARALGLAWGAQVRGFPTLALVAAMARRERPGPVSVCMAGGHGEWFMQDFDAAGMPAGDLLSTGPDSAAGLATHSVIAGNRAQQRAAQLAGHRETLSILPDARFAQDIPSSLLSDNLTPIYGRPPDARLPA